MAKATSTSRRSFLGGLGLAGLAGGAAALQRWLPGAAVPAAQSQSPTPNGQHNMTGMAGMDPMSNMGNMLEGEVDNARNGFDPMQLLTDFDYGTVSTLPNGQTLREYKIYAADKTIEVAPGVTFPAWTYNGRVPGPTIRCTEGDRIRVQFINGSSHPHSMHFHGFHPANMDGVEPIPSGSETVYEFDAEPFGLHVYHCHVPPFMRHIHKGLYGTFIIDPPTPRPAANELVMVMNGFDTNLDGANEVYAVNTVAFHYTKNPIPLKIDELVRIYLVNMTEFDLINSFHLHANLFNVYRTGTKLEPDEYTDVLMLCQAERHILEFRYNRPGQFMFHAHQSEFNQLGWMGVFNVADENAIVTPPVAAIGNLCRVPAVEKRNG